MWESNPTQTARQAVMQTTTSMSHIFGAESGTRTHKYLLLRQTPLPYLATSAILNVKINLFCKIKTFNKIWWSLGDSNSSEMLAKHSCYR